MLLRRVRVSQSMKQDGQRCMVHEAERFSARNFQRSLNVAHSLENTHRQVVTNTARLLIQFQRTIYRFLCAGAIARTMLNSRHQGHVLERQGVEAYRVSHRRHARVKLAINYSLTGPARQD